MKNPIEGFEGKVTISPKEEQKGEKMGKIEEKRSENWRTSLESPHLNNRGSRDNRNIGEEINSKILQENSL